MAQKGLVLIYTGDGKGKSTAAFGQALRAAGNGFKVCIIQFIKGADNTGEAKAFSRLADMVEFHVKGSGFTWQIEDKTKAIQTAREAFNFAREKINLKYMISKISKAKVLRKINSNSYDMVVLDELTYIVTYNMVSEEDVLEMIQNRPERLHLVITGRGATENLIDSADLVTEMVPVKHHYEKGVKAQRGVEF